MKDQSARRLLVLTHEFPPFRGGIGTYSEQVARAAARKGIDVTVLAPRFGQQQPPTELAPGLTIKYFPGGVFRHWQFPFVLLLTLAFCLMHRRSTILAADWPFVAACGLLSRILPLRHTAILHGSEILFFRRSRLLNLITLGNPFFGARVICANSHFTASLLFQSYPQVPKSRVRVTYLGVNPFWFTTTTRDRDTVLNRLGIPTDKQIILSVGRLHPRKGQGRCIAALSRLEKPLRDRLVYAVVGQAVDAKYKEELDRAAASADFAVVFTGVIADEDMLALYRSSTVFCLPSQTDEDKVEGFGLVFLEAAGSGLPSVAVNAGAVPEVVLDSRTGLLVEPDDEVALSDGLRAMLTDTELRNRLGSAAETSAKSFTWDRCASETLAP